MCGYTWSQKIKYSYRRKTSHSCLCFWQPTTSQKNGGEDCLQTLNGKAWRAVASISMPYTTQGSYKTMVCQAEISHTSFFFNSSQFLSWQKLRFSSNILWFFHAPPRSITNFTASELWTSEIWGLPVVGRHGIAKRSSYLLYSRLHVLL